jgi:Zinc finger C-x8-C-x5-C-x3-H type (and similar)
MPGPHEDGGMIYTTSELNDPEYSTDDFRMFHFKVARCSKRYVHDWRSCPFAHPTENARRRDPRTTRYLPVPCPDYKRGICMRGDTCPYSHGVYECWLHPAKYRTQLCKEGPSCRRPVCFFAHSVGDLRQPTHLWNGSNGEGVQAPGSAAANLLLHQNQQQLQYPAQPAINTDVIKTNNNNNLNMHMAQRSQSDAANNMMQVAAEEAFNNMQEHSVLVHSGSAYMPTTGQTQSIDSPPLSPLRATGSGESNGEQLSDSQKDGEDDTPHTPSHQGGDPFANSNATVDGVALGHSIAASSTTQEDASVAASDMASQQSSEDNTNNNNNSSAANGTTIAAASAAVAAAAASAAASRISLDSNMQQRAANQAARTGQPSWSQGLAASASAAVALAGVPVNEQPMLPNHGPRMSNAVARKLGLAPVKPPTAVEQQQQQQPVRSTAVGARAANSNTTPGRHSIDGALPIQHQQQSAAYQQQARASMDEMRLSQAALAGFGGNGNGMAFPTAMGSQFGGSSGSGGSGMYSSSYPGSADALGIHPALLNLVAANMANGNNHNNNGGNGVNNAALQQYHHQQQMQQQMQQQQQQLFAYSQGGGGGDPHGFANGNNGGNGVTYHNNGMMMMNGNNGGMVMEDPGVASLLGHMSQWGLSESSGESIRGEGSVHSSKNSQSFPHRGSSDGMLGATGLPQQGPSFKNNNGGGQASYLMSLDLGEANNNNNRSVPSEC